MIVFEGQKRAEEDLAALKVAVAAMAVKPKIVSIYFAGDAGSVVYSQKKQAAAKEVGIEFEIVEQRFETPLEDIITLIRKMANDEKVNGIMIQKPRKNSYVDHFLSRGKKPQYVFKEWWRKLTENIPTSKDVDGLSPQTQVLLAQGSPEAMMPATMRAVLKILENQDLKHKKILIIGRSDLLGIPLAEYWRSRGYEVTLCGREQLQEKLLLPGKLTEYQVIVSATGQADLIRGEMIAKGVILVDVGEPQADVQMASVKEKASFLTPVPGGVGPLTISSLLENSLNLLTRSRMTIAQKNQTYAAKNRAFFEKRC